MVTKQQEVLFLVACAGLWAVGMAVVALRRGHLRRQRQKGRRS